MTSDSKVKILSKLDQSKSISKGRQNRFQKSKKPQSRLVLESPFLLEWPKIDDEQNLKLVSSITDSFTGMKKITFKPDWKLCRKLKGQEQKDFIKDYNISQLQKQKDEDPSFEDKLSKLKLAWSELVLGYNQVMVAIEKGSVAAVLVEKDTTPAHLSLTFLPSCANNGVVLVPIAGLQKIIKDDNLLGLSHSCMVIGLKNSVKNHKSKFYNLYQEMCLALNIEENSDDEMETEDDIENEATKELAAVTKLKDDPKIKPVLLKRVSKNTRVFIPGKPQNLAFNEEEMKEKENISQKDSSDEFISFGSPKSQISGNNISQTSTSQRKSKNVLASQNISLLDFDSMFVVDEQGCKEEESSPDVPSPSSQNVSSKSQQKTNIQKKKRKRTDDDSTRYFYKSATMKKIKNNPKRNN